MWSQLLQKMYRQIFKDEAELCEEKNNFLPELPQRNQGARPDETWENMGVANQPLNNATVLDGRNENWHCPTW